MAAKRPRKSTKPQDARSAPDESSRSLTPKQRRFAELYAGNGTEAARLAGYAGRDNVLAQTARGLLRNPHIRALIAEREGKEVGPHIATREQRQAFWTRTMEDTEEDMPQRLKASELLAKSQGDFLERVELAGKDGGPVKADVTAKVEVKHVEPDPERLSAIAGLLARLGALPSPQGTAGAGPAAGAADE
ncbi:terminase small subunit [Myxococcus sp. K38C18041901]|uniref:terminase small subunit n=1 Tax=Myxococcus guangdongensis TaxID=2906760 RepID=UPI0020A73CCD|nr:terminase small subunit [Myxococcus guangdongensis]MCP3065813.1 terminase small subunit [Myxococcus guangdongensis]